MLITDADKKHIEELIAKMCKLVEDKSFNKASLPKIIESKFISEKYGDVIYAFNLYEFFNKKINETQYAVKLMITLPKVKGQEDISWGSMEKIKQDLSSYKHDPQLVLNKLPDLYMIMLS